MRTRPIRPGEIDLFIDATVRPDHREDTKQYLQSMFAAGSMHPEWCFVIQEVDNRPLGWVAFWTLPGMEKPFALVLFEVHWEGDHAGVGTRLLGDVLDEARRLGADRIEHVLDTPPMRPQFQHHPGKRLEVLEGAGFAFRRETDRFHRRAEEPPPPFPAGFPSARWKRSARPRSSTR